MFVSAFLIQLEDDIVYNSKSGQHYVKAKSFERKLKMGLCKSNTYSSCGLKSVGLRAKKLFLQGRQAFVILQLKK